MLLSVLQELKNLGRAAAVLRSSGNVISFHKVYMEHNLILSQKIKGFMFYFSIAGAHPLKDP